MTTWQWRITQLFMFILGCFIGNLIVRWLRSQSVLEILQEQFGLGYVNRPQIARTKRSSNYPVGTLRDLADFIINCPDGKIVEINFNALTASNISAISQSLKVRAYKLHCVRLNDKRVMWAEQELVLNGN